MGLKCVLIFQSTPVNLADSESVQSSHNKPVLRDPFVLPKALTSFLSQDECPYPIPLPTDVRKTPPSTSTLCTWVQIV